MTQHEMTEHDEAHHHEAHDGEAHNDHAIEFTPEFWDERYGSAEQVWSGNPNPHVITFAGPLTPGTALDVGCGEGADAVWLAQQGWQVTGVDVSAVALERAARAASAAGVAERTTWQTVDARSWDPAPHQYDLISAQFMHFPPPEREALHRRLAAAVRPQGTLLIVGHHRSDVEVLKRHPDHARLMYLPDELATFLDPADWLITVSEPQRPAVVEGRTVMMRDAILHAVRR